MAEQYGFFVDSTRCVKCYACEVACQQWHELKANTVHRRTVQEECAGTFPNVTRTFTSLSCMHCENPACVEKCPQGAIGKREEDGAVIVDREKCIGCKTCSAACPFDVPQYLEAEDGGLKMDKCDMCLTLGREADEAPRCVNTCPTKALHFGTLADMAELAKAKGGSQLEGETKPSVYVARA
ncbi:4Fe-4S dicluster domain-containing protein [Arabiibacter massiliensis]|uniref:4Fe-4S dicluster domain-containing protein n=1 Tax=Arabiibacter massiliensis TaxID=1870985 RepID=UPI0009BA9CA9|nr:4Fe-4S dicluster domain-containing protein [Arabiibacter massiliensis]